MAYGVWFSGLPSKNSYRTFSASAFLVRAEITSCWFANQIVLSCRYHRPDGQRVSLGHIGAHEGDPSRVG